MIQIRKNNLKFAPSPTIFLQQKIKNYIFNIFKIDYKKFTKIIQLDYTNSIIYI